MATVEDYGFVLDGWRPACGLEVWADCRKIRHLGLDYVEFRCVVAGRVVTCRVDPCPPEATAPYAVMVRRDMDHEIRKALHGGRAGRPFISLGAAREPGANTRPGRRASTAPPRPGTWRWPT